MIRTIIICAALLGATIFGALAQTDDQLREMYFRRDFKQMEKLARDGDPRAQAWMGLIMQQAERWEDAKVWWRRAAEQGIPWALNTMYRTHFMHKEYEQAAYWARRGAEANVDSLQASFADLLLNGTGVAKNDQEAFRWYAAAVAQQFKHAYGPLAELYATGTGTARNSIEAYSLCKIAEFVLPDSDSLGRQKVQDLITKLQSELSSEQLAQAMERAKEMRPDIFARRSWWLRWFR